MLRGRAVIVAMVLLAAACGGSAGGGGGSARPKGSKPATGPATIKFTSPAFGDGAEIPDGFTCDGANASPPLRWSGLPAGTRELVLVVTDPDAPGGTFVHWVIWGIAGNATGIAEHSVPPGSVQGKNQVGNAGWSGPCPPRGSEPHHYVFTLFALKERIDLQPGASADDLRAATLGKVLARARLVGTYRRK